MCLLGKVLKIGIERDQTKSLQSQPDKEFKMAGITKNRKTAKSLLSVEPLGIFGINFV